MTLTTPLLGIDLCETEHQHATTCRHACAICDGLYPPASLTDGICAACWREHNESGGPA